MDNQYTFLFGQLVAIYSIVVFASEFFNCHEFCEKSEFPNNEKVIFQTETYKYSHYYKYSQLIRFNQSSPIVSGNFEKPAIEEKIDLRFPFTFYGANVSTIIVESEGKINLQGQWDLALIHNYIFGNVLCENEILNENVNG
ncbi:hypothetical protein MS3_00011099 [Schistosoma haematobium]|uniref:Uncharacterized protein n=2 Tax=Schistosoma haematobium TaxID=6185 RepID=A0A922IIU6_SCHHA|nr:hypothetical protein MS3_00011099 [Schistosoma haematobium]KAH9580237.1 hypothetical protein MS3_00011099 [Schistosoma haematobium]